MSWAQKRRFTYISVIILFLVIFIVLPTVIYLYKPPTCFDGKQNQDEQGIDCGGVCTLLCPAQYVPLNVLWSRFVKVNDGVYNVLSYIENPNINAGADNLDYTFKLYDKDGVLLVERRGRTFTTPNKIMAIFEGDLITQNSIPHRVDFSFLSRAVWVKQEGVESGISVTKPTFSRLETAPRLTVILENKTINQIKNIEAIGIVYNVDGNAIGFSRTIVDSISDRGQVTVNFNWPKPFTDTPTRSEIILKVLKK